MFGLTTDAIMSILRHLLTFVGGLVVAKGWITADVAGELSGALVTIIGALFATFFHATSNGVLQAVSTTPNIGLVNANVTNSA